MRAFVALSFMAACDQGVRKQASPVPRDASSDVFVSVDDVAPSATWPRLMESGFEPMTKQMGSRPVVEASFPGLRVDRHEPAQLLLTGAGVVATVSLDDNGTPERVYLNAGDIKTEHGLRVGDPLERVLQLDVPHTCETVWNVAHSGMSMVGAIRCWVGRSPPHFRYVAYAEKGLLGVRAPRDLPPSGGPDLERWIRTTDARIELIIWHRDPGSDAP